MGDRVILHCDLNNFFASVEVRLDKSLKGHPVAVCGNPEERKGIVLAKCERAKKCGVKTGDTVWQAKSKCPDIIIVVPKHDEYGKHSKMVQQIYYRYTDKVESFGIDECWLDITASMKLFGDKMVIAERIKEEIKRELDLTISIGVSWNKTYAKIGSDIKKPDAITEINRTNYQTILYPLPVSNMLFVGRKTVAVFEKLNIKTIGDLANYDKKLLSARLGINADKLVRAARGEDDDEVANFHFKREIKSIGNGTTAKRDLTNIREVEQLVYVLSEEVAYRMRRKGLKGRTISVSIRDANLKWHGAQTSILQPTNSCTTIQQTAMRVFTQLHQNDDKKPEVTVDGFARGKIRFEPVRSIRIAVSNFGVDEIMQLSLFEDNSQEERNDELSKVFDTIRRKYGTNKVTFGTALDRLIDFDFEVIDE